MSNYPISIDTQLVILDKNTPINPNVHNALRSAIIAVESELGIKPSSTFGTVRARLDYIDNRINLLDPGIGGDAVSINGIPVTTTSLIDGYTLTYDSSAETISLKAPVSIPSGIPLKICTPEQFGAVSDGITDDSAAFQSAIDAVSDGTYGGIQLSPNSTYLVTGPFVLPQGICIRGYGDTSVIKTTGNAAVFDASEENIVLSDFKILGSSTGSSQHGIICGDPLVSNSGAQNGTIHNIQLINLGGAGYSYSSNPFTPFGGPNLSNVVAIGDGYGFYFGTRGEYVNLTNCIAESCTTGVYVAAGNVNWNGGSIIANTTGVKLVSGDNDSHGIFSGVNINHNTTAISVGQISNGETFSGCHIFAGAIQLTNSTGVQFVGCEIDVTSYTFDGSVGTTFDHCLLGAGNTNTITELNSPNTSWTGSKSYVNSAPSWLGNRQSGPFTRGSEIFIGTDPLYNTSAQALGIRMYAAPGGTGYFGTGSTATGFWNSTGLNTVTNFQVGVTQSFGGGTGVIGIANASITPTTNPSGGVVLYSDSTDGYLKYRQSTGNIITLSGGSGGGGGTTPIIFKFSGNAHQNTQSFFGDRGLDSQLGTSNLINDTPVNFPLPVDATFTKMYVFLTTPIIDPGATLNVQFVYDSGFTIPGASIDFTSADGGGSKKSVTFSQALLEGQTIDLQVTANNLIPDPTALSAMVVGWYSA